MLFGAVALLLFGGKGKISDLMGDVAKGVKSFKKGLADDDETPASAPTDRPADDREPRRRRRRTTFTRSAERALKRSACDWAGVRQRRSTVAGSGEPCSISTLAR